MKPLVKRKSLQRYVSEKMIRDKFGDNEGDAQMFLVENAPMLMGSIRSTVKNVREVTTLSMYAFVEYMQEQHDKHVNIAKDD